MLGAGPELAVKGVIREAKKESVSLKCWGRSSSVFQPAISSRVPSTGLSHPSLVIRNALQRQTRAPIAKSLRRNYGHVVYLIKKKSKTGAVLRFNDFCAQ